MSKNLVAAIVLVLALAFIAVAALFTLSGDPEATQPPGTQTTQPQMLPATTPTTTTPAPAPTVGESVQKTPDAPQPVNLDAVKAPVAGYLQAKQQRDFSQAQPYLTPAYAATYNQEAFAGTSNPHWGRYTILGGPIPAADGQSYTVTARVYQEYTGQGEIGYSEDTFVVMPVGGQYLISDVEIGSYVALQ